MPKVAGSRPSSRLSTAVAQPRAGELLARGAAPDELFELLGQLVDDHHGPIRGQPRERRRALGRTRVEQHRLEARDVPPRRRGGKL